MPFAGTSKEVSSHVDHHIIKGREKKRKRKRRVIGYFFPMLVSLCFMPM